MINAKTHLSTITDKYFLALSGTCDIYTEVNLTTGFFTRFHFAEDKMHFTQIEGDYKEIIFHEMENNVLSYENIQSLQKLDLDSLRRQLLEAPDKKITCEYRKKVNNNTIWVRSVAKIIKENNVNLAIIITKDISIEKENRQLREQLVWKQEEHYYENQKVIAVLYDMTQKLPRIGNSASEILQGNFNNRNLLNILVEDNVVHPKDRTRLTNFFHKMYITGMDQYYGEFRLLVKEGGYRWFQFLSTNLRDSDNQLQQILLCITNIEERIAARKELKHQLDLDDLTEVYNKKAFFKKTKKLLEVNDNNQYMIVTLDIERFRFVNTLFGVSEGDRLLCFVAKEIKKYVDPIGTYGRIGGDIFAMCIPFDAVAMDVVVATVEERARDYNLPMELHISLGTYIIEDRSLPIDIMCDRANMALQTIKGIYTRNFAYYDEFLSMQLLEEQEIISSMETALLDRQFTVFLQPKYCIDDRSVIGCEALVRWNHPSKGYIRPDKFIPIFEQNGFIMQLDSYVWEKACQILRKWINEGKEVYPISVNVSRVDIYSPNFISILVGLVKKYNLDPRLLELELTESAYTEEPAQMIKAMTELQNHGFVVLMDDFGSGYSSLNMLKDISVDKLKIDLNFLIGMEDNSRGKCILESVIYMAKRLDIPVIVEGVETIQQQEFLQSLGCQYAQGYLFSKPIPVSEYEKFEEENRKSNY